VGRRLVFAALIFAAPTVAFARDEPGLPRQELNAADTRRAKASLLRPSDFRGLMHMDSRGRGIPLIPHCSGYPGDRSGTTVTGKASSSFTDGFDVTGSTALFFKSQFDAIRYWKLTVRPVFAKCDAFQMRRNIKRGWKAKTMFAGELRLDRIGADEAAYRDVTHMFGAGHRAYDWYQTTVFVRSGRSVAFARIAYANQPCNCHPDIARVLTLRLFRASHG
jgi:hypothetical protein